MKEPTPIDLAFKETESDENQVVDNLATSGFIQKYVEYASAQTDAPRIYHLATALTMMGASMGNKVSYHTWGTDMYANLWVCLLAPSGFYRKSSSIRMGKNIVTTCDNGLMLPKDWTREKLVQQLGQRGDGFLIAEEFGEMLAKLSRDYMSGSKEMLTALFDGDKYDRKTVGGGTTTIDNPAITILAASTIDWINDKVSQGDLRGGFLSRFLFVPAKVKNDFRGVGEGYDAEKRKRLEEMISVRMGTKGEMNFSKVKPILDEWIYKFEQQVDNNPDPRLMGFFSRAGTYLLKLCMCFQLSDSAGSLVVQKETAEKAIVFWDFVAQQIKTVVCEQITTTRDQKLLRQIIEAIRMLGGKATRQELLKATGMFNRTFDPAAQTLLDSGLVVMFDEKHDGKGRPSRVFKLVSPSKLIDDSALPPMIELKDWREDSEQTIT